MPKWSVMAASRKVVKFPRPVIVTLSPGSTLWNVEGIPVAVIETPQKDFNVLAFDSPNPRPFSRFAVVRRGTPISREHWDKLVNKCRSERPAPRPSGRG